MTAAAFLTHAVTIGLVLVGCAALIGTLRLWRGPTLADRVVALDMMTSAVIGFCGLFAVRTGIEGYLDIAVALALVSFVSVVALARYATQLARRSGEDD